MSVSQVSTFSRQPHLAEATAAEPDAAYTTDLHRWLIQWHQEYKVSLNAVITGYLPMDGTGTMTGNLAFSGAALRITGDFTNATLADRLSVQTSTANSETILQFLPSGTANVAGIVAFSNSNAASAQPAAALYQSGTASVLAAYPQNGGTQGPLQLQLSATAVLTLQTNNDMTLGPSGAATTMTSGFPYIPAAAGAPTGAPTARTGYVPIYYDSTGNNLYAYNGAWKRVALA